MQRDGRVAIVSSTALRVLRHCLFAKTLEAHASFIRQIEGVNWSHDQAVELLCGLIASGVLVARDAGPTGDRVRLTTVMVTTSDRPAVLRRCIDSYLSYFRSIGRPVHVIVVDGSRETTCEAANAVVAESASRAWNTPVSHVGRTCRVRIRAMAVSLGIPSAVAAWVFPDPPSGYAAGAVRNLGLIASAGRACLTVDDDTICRPWSPGESTPARIEFAGHVDPERWSFWDSRHAAIQHLAAPQRDLLTWHEAVLGQSLHALGAMAVNDCGLTAVCSHLERAIQARAGTVAAAWGGLAGDSAQYCRYRMLLALGHTRDALASGDALLLALRSREVQRCARSLWITDNAALMTYCASLDNRWMLPPFSPIGFNEDGLFAATMKAVVPGAFIASLPVGVVHDSLRPSLYDDDRMLSATQVRLADIMTVFLKRWSDTTGAGSVVERVQRLAKELQTLSSLTDADLSYEVVRAAASVKAALVSSCEQRLQSDFPYPPHWRTSLQLYRDRVLESMQSPAWYWPIESISDGDEGAPRSIVRQYLGRFGEALMAWPVLWTHFASQPLLPMRSDGACG